MDTPERPTPRQEAMLIMVDYATRAPLHSNIDGVPGAFLNNAEVDAVRDLLEADIIAAREAEDA